jgi:hypothetical protein
LLPARADPVADADPFPETCAPDLSVCTEVCVCAEAPPCTDAELCAATVHAPNIPTKAIERMRFMCEGLLESEFISLKYVHFPNNFLPSDAKRNFQYEGNAIFQPYHKYFIFQPIGTPGEKGT